LIEIDFRVIKIIRQLRRFLEICSFFRHNGSFYGTNLKTDPTINTGGKVNPIPVGSFHIFARARMDTGNGTGIYAIGNSFTNVCHNAMGHGFSLIKCNDHSLAYTIFGGRFISANFQKR
jgi:hypothetical protein